MYSAVIDRSNFISSRILAVIQCLLVFMIVHDIVAKYGKHQHIKTSSGLEEPQAEIWPIEHIIILY